MPDHVRIAYLFFCTVVLPIGVTCITSHLKFRIACLEKDVLQTAVVAIHHARLNPIPDPTGNQVSSLLTLGIVNWNVFVVWWFQPAVVVIIYIMQCFVCFRTSCLAAYRQFTWWVHGVLDKKRRRVILACVVKTIRKEFPEESDTNTGFREANLELWLALNIN